MRNRILIYDDLFSCKFITLSVDLLTLKCLKVKWHFDWHIPELNFNLSVVQYGSNRMNKNRP